MHTVGQLVLNSSEAPSAADYVVLFCEEGGYMYRLSVIDLIGLKFRGVEDTGSRAAENRRQKFVVMVNCNAGHVILHGTLFEQKSITVAGA